VLSYTVSWPWVGYRTFSPPGPPTASPLGAPRSASPWAPKCNSPLSLHPLLLIVGPGLAAAFHRARLPTLTLRDCPALSVSYLQAFHLLLARDEATAALLCPSPLTDVPSPPSGPSWDLTILLTLVAVIVRASACAGFTLRGPPWQLEGRNAVALVWNDHLDTLPPDFQGD